MNGVCGLCGHPPHEPQKCGYVTEIHGGHSDYVIGHVPCPCWGDGWKQHHER